MDDAIASALATLIGAITTVLLMAGAFYFGPGALRKKRGRDDGEYEKFLEWQAEQEREDNVQ